MWCKSEAASTHIGVEPLCSIEAVDLENAGVGMEWDEGQCHKADHVFGLDVAEDPIAPERGRQGASKTLGR